MTTMKPHKARTELLEFALLNGHSEAAFGQAMGVLRNAVRHEGQPVHVHYTGNRRTAPRHACLEDIVGDPKANQLAAIATEATPGTHFSTQIRNDRCETFTVSTNAPA
ncbi:MAG TPA: hypothetical protein VLE72_00155 [Candidatus Saccharimonadales bacterium]|nr:hypothetical protein [Candidatus Saccharimonadales bacterium]